MRRLNFLGDEPWDEAGDDLKRARWFGHPFGADMLGASLTEYLPGSPGGPLHMHYGVEEMFFVLKRNTDRSHAGGRGAGSRPGTSSTSPKARTACMTSRTRRASRARVLGISCKRFPDVVAYPERGVAWVATRHPERPVPQGGDEGIIARFELP